MNTDKPETEKLQPVDENGNPETLHPDYKIRYQTRDKPSLSRRERYEEEARKRNEVFGRITDAAKVNPNPRFSGPREPADSNEITEVFRYIGNFCEDTVPADVLAKAATWIDSNKGPHDIVESKHLGPMPSHDDVFGEFSAYAVKITRPHDRSIRPEHEATPRIMDDAMFELSKEKLRTTRKVFIRNDELLFIPDPKGHLTVTAELMRALKEKEILLQNEVDVLRIRIKARELNPLHLVLAFVIGLVVVKVFEAML